jgi:phospholipid transport system substrate-binding protein
MKKFFELIGGILLFPFGVIMMYQVVKTVDRCLSDHWQMLGFCPAKYRVGRSGRGVGMLVLGVLLMASGSAIADTSAGPLEAVQSGTAEVLRILDSGMGQAETAAAVKAEVGKHFDFERMTMAAVGPAWKKLDEGKRAELVRLFSELLVRVYLDRINGNRPDSLAYQPAKIDGDQAGVQAVIHSQGRQIDVLYLLYSSDGKAWRVRDVNVEGISLAGNYRAQFADIIGKSGVDGLITKLREKVAERGNG